MKPAQSAQPTEPASRGLAPKALFLAAMLLAGIPLTATPPVAAQTGAAAGTIEEVVVTGTRRQARSVHESPAPIDVLGGEDFRNQGNTDMVELLRTVVPSFNVNTQPISDASTVIRPVNLRGLAPDHTLVLINGKRRHRAAAIGWLTNGVSDGAQGPDVSVIPAIALRQVEVLRDGAAAQYGSDAIAGVMNFILKDDSSGGSFETKMGEYSEGSENDWLIAANFGLPFTDDGFFNVSFEYGESDETFRAVQRADAAALIEAGRQGIPTPAAQNWGNPRISPNFKSFFNMAVALGPDSEAYAFGNYAQKEGEGSFYYRNPNTRGGVFSTDGGETWLVGDVGRATDGTPTCPYAAGGMMAPVPATLDGAKLADIIDDPNCFVFNEHFPGGFTPRFGADAEDASLIAGLRGTLDNGVNYDVSVAYGNNDADFFIFNTVNGSLGPDSPTSFDPGDYTQTEHNFNVDITYPVTVDSFASDLNVAAGFEYRIENFELTAGDEESYIDGPYANQGFSIGANGFPGFPADIAGDWSRTNYALYLDLEADVTDRWLVGVAVRYEDFDTFGDTANGKFATHLRVNDWLGLRATWSTGFRAPTPGQQNAANTTSAFDGTVMDIVHRSTIPSTSSIAALRGGTVLAEEQSENTTFGAVLELGDIDVSIDYYSIELTDRIALTEDFNFMEGEREQLIAEGVPMARDVDDFRFFQNAFDTETVGLDIVATYSMDLFNGSTDFSLAWNNNETEVNKFKEMAIDEQRIREVEDGLPKSRYNFAVTHLSGDWRFLLRYNFVDEWYDEEDDGSTTPAAADAMNLGQTRTDDCGVEYMVSTTVDPFDGYYDGYSSLDFEVAYQVNERLNLVFGGQNFTDQYPDEHCFATTTLGNQYSQFAPLGFNGSFFYGRLRYDW